MAETIEQAFQAPTSKLEEQASALAEQVALEDEALAQFEARLKERKEANKVAKTQLAELLIQAGLQSIKLDSGLNPKVKQNRKFFTATGTTDENLHSWLRNQELGSIIKPHVHFQTLQATLKAYEEQGNELPDMFNIVTENTVTMYGKSKFLNSKGQNNG
jgi:hypothetical protein